MESKYTTNRVKASRNNIIKELSEKRKHCVNCITVDVKCRDAMDCVKNNYRDFVEKENKLSTSKVGVATQFIYREEGLCEI